MFGESSGGVRSGGENHDAIDLNKSKPNMNNIRKATGQDFKAAPAGNDSFFARQKYAVPYGAGLRSVAKLLVVLLLASFNFALRGAVVPSEDNHVKSLDGTWRFKLEQPGGYDPQSTNGDRPMPIRTPATFEPFQKTDYQEGTTWTNLVVPGNWEMAGLSPATYNQPDNASGFYRLWFKVPASWKGRGVRLVFDGVQNGAEFWLNGNAVSVDEPSWGRDNYHESGWTAFQVDLTPQVKFGEQNLLAVRVTKNTKSADLDSGDYFFLGGIYRTVKLFSVPQTHVEDVTVQTRLLDGNRAEVKVLVAITGEDASDISMDLRASRMKPARRSKTGRRLWCEPWTGRSCGRRNFRTCTTSP